MNLAAQMLRAPGQLAERCLQERDLRELALFSIAAIALGGAAFGASIGGFRGGATDEARNGTGLGLAIAASVAQAHGGELVLEEPADGPGARFALKLPIAASA